MIRAMKSMKKTSLLKEEETKMFAEMNILKNLDQPNIVRLYELFQDEENYYLITECFFIFCKIDFIMRLGIVRAGNYSTKSSQCQISRKKSQLNT